MHRASLLRAGMRRDQDRVFLDASGEVRPEPLDVPAGPAVLVVSPVTDAVKQVSDDRVGSSVDRDEVLKASGFVLGREVLDALGFRWVDTSSLFREVEVLGYSWVVWEYPGPI